MLVHHVRFYLKPDLSADRRAALRHGIESLRAIPDVNQFFVGTPAAVPSRPVIDTEYGYALTVVFADVAAHNRYQTHPLHLKFVADCHDFWTRVAVVDSEGAPV